MYITKFMHWEVIEASYLEQIKQNKKNWGVVKNTRKIGDFI